MTSARQALSECKCCSECKTFKAPNEFPARGAYRRGVCKECRNAAQRNGRTRWSGTSRQAYDRERFQKLKADTAAYEATKAKRRAWYKEKKNRPRIIQEPWVGLNSRDCLYAPPMQRWLEAKVVEYEGYQALAEMCGVSDRTMYRLWKGEVQGVTLDLADLLLTREESTSLWDLWPELHPIHGPGMAEGLLWARQCAAFGAACRAILLVATPLATFVALEG